MRWSMPEVKPKVKPGCTRCKLCNEDIPRKEFYAHLWSKHREQQLAASAKGAAARRKKSQAGSAGKPPEQPKPPKTPATTELAPGEVFHVTPKAFTTTSTLFWQAWEIAVREWGWPKDMTPQKFLDNVLYYYAKRRGYVIGGYTKVEPNGHKTYSEEEVKQAVEAAMSKLRGG